MVTSKQGSGNASEEVGEDTRVSLSYMPLGHDSSPLLHIPHGCMKLYSLKPRKWLLYVATNICGIDGRLRLLDRGEDLTGEEMEKNVNPGDHYVFCFDGEANFLDWHMRGIHCDNDSYSSILSCAVPEQLKDYYGGCPFIQEPPDECNVCYLIPFEKGDDYLHRLLASRGDPNNTMTINDYQNQIIASAQVYRAFDRKNNAFLKTPNRFLKTSEVPGGENDPPDIYCVTVHCFLESDKRRANLHHGARSHMTGSSGLEHPPAGQRRTVAEYLPKDILLDVTYAYTVLYRFCSTDAKEMLKKYAEDRYPVDIAKERRIRRLRRDKEQPEKDQRQIAFWDWVDVMQMKIHGIRPEDIQGEEERRKREADELDAQRIARWQKGVDESYCGEHDVNDGRSEMDEGEVVLHAYAGDDENPVSIEEALSRQPPSYSIWPAETYSNSIV